jgi:hypothetical protein
LRQQLRRDNFNGQCKPCGQIASREGTFQTKARKNGGRRQLHKSGYVVRGPTSVPAGDLPIFRQMQNRAGTVLEHRWIMACHLGRALMPDELVDHKNGIKSDNAIDNLRIYIRGKNHEGSSNGYGTYYHEWQMAEAEIRRLKLQLANERDIGG